MWMLLSSIESAGYDDTSSWEQLVLFMRCVGYDEVLNDMSIPLVNNTVK